MVTLLLAIIYLSFISLGLPDALLGSAWPSMCAQFQVPVSYAGIISFTIAGGTVISSLLSDRLTCRWGTARVTAVSVATTAVALLGFSVTRSYWVLLLWAIPYGLGAGSVDAALNNYVAVHYASRHMSWLHCMWGIGATVGPYIMGLTLTGGYGWNMGYRVIGLMQTVLAAVLFLTLPVWRIHKSPAEKDEKPRRPLSLRQIGGIPGVKEILVAFFCYCAVEQTAGLWAATYCVSRLGVSAERAASLASLFYLGITAGRGVSGFLTIRFDDKTMIRMGQGIILLGVAAMILPLGSFLKMAGLILIGLGCAPIYPCVIHSTPAHFGAENSQAIIGVQMASAYVGTLAMPPIFGLLADRISLGLLPWYLLAITALMIVMCEKLNRVAQTQNG